MKVCVLQPYYSMNYEDRDLCFEEELKLMDQCDESLDLIVLPEYSDIPVNTPNEEEFKRCIMMYNETVLTKAKELAVRCKAIVCVNCADKTPTGYRNTTHVINKEGIVVGKYYKSHPAPSEYKTKVEGGNELDCSYVTEYKPYTVIVDGLKLGFMTCYDFYFYEDFVKLARENVDIIIGCSHQRTDSHEYLETLGKFLSYNTNAYLVRSSVSLGKESTICGSSMVVSPKGEMILNMKSDIGLGITEINPKEKYYKPAGFKGKPAAHWQYVDVGREYIKNK